MTAWPVRILICCAAAICSLAAAAPAAAATTERVSVGPSSVQANGASFSPLVADDGRYVVFASHATNLVAGDSNHKTDVFLRDRLLGRTFRISVSSGEAQANGASTPVAVSHDGRFVLFNSKASNLVKGDTNTVGDTFLRDRMHGTTGRVQRVDGSQIPGGSTGFDVSDIGRYITFVLSVGAYQHLYLRDRTGNTNLLLAKIYHGDGEFTGAVLSAAPLVAAADFGDVQLFDAAGHRLQNITAEGVGCSSVGFFDPDLSITPDGSTLGVTCLGDAETDAYMINVVGPSAVPVADPSTTSSSACGISDDGRWLAFTTPDALVPADTNGRPDVYRFDSQHGGLRRASLTPDGAVIRDGAGGCDLEGDGNAIAFTSDDANVVRADTNGVTDVFLHTFP